jgi:cytochrome c oxidase subunit 4
MFLVWLALMALLTLTCASAYIRMGTWNGIINLAIAAAKAALVGIFFMHLGKAHGHIRLCVAVALFMLALLFGIGSTDYATRMIYQAPWQQPAVSRSE